jgi:hypothetical protein
MRICSILGKHFKPIWDWRRYHGCKCYGFAKLTKESQQEFLNAYYDKEKELVYLIRTTIHSCDFSSGSYTYVEEGVRH